MYSEISQSRALAGRTETRRTSGRPGPRGRTLSASIRAASVKEPAASETISPVYAFQQCGRSVGWSTELCACVVCVYTTHTDRRGGSAGCRPPGRWRAPAPNPCSGRPSAARSSSAPRPWAGAGACSTGRRAPSCSNDAAAYCLLLFAKLRASTPSSRFVARPQRPNAHPAESGGWLASSSRPPCLSVVEDCC